jgi:hypothetical protein
LLGDPPIDWSAVRTAEDYRRFADRDGYYAGVVEREVLTKGRRALLVVGGLHIIKRGPDGGLLGAPGVGELIERRHPGMLYSIFPLPPSPAIAATLGMRQPPDFKPLAGSDLESRSFGEVLPKGLMRQVTENGVKVWKPFGELPWPPMGHVVEALLYLGDDAAQVEPAPATYLDPVYQRDLRARIPVLREFYGIDFLPELEELIAKAKATAPSAPPSKQ